MTANKSKVSINDKGDKSKKLMFEKYKKQLYLNVF